jgi:hypothetical protein
LLLRSSVLFKSNDSLLLFDLLDLLREAEPPDAFDASGEKSGIDDGKMKEIATTPTRAANPK